MLASVDKTKRTRLFAINFALAAIFALWFFFSSRGISYEKADIVPSPPVTKSTPSTTKSPATKPLNGDAAKEQFDDEDDYAINDDDYMGDYEEIAKGASTSSTTKTSTETKTTMSTPTSTATISSGGNWRFPPDMPFLEALGTCESFKCIRDAHMQPKGEAKYNFPHFIIAGYPKCATTSLYKHINENPAILGPYTKEPQFFTGSCTYEAGRMFCPDAETEEYIKKILKRDAFVENKGQLVQFEASPGTMSIGPDLAENLHEFMPWLKITASLRDPISRGMSKSIMHMDKSEEGCLMKKDIGECMLETFSHYGYTYSRALKAWLDNFPTEQILIMQYEDLTGDERQEYELRRFKKFIGVDPEVPENTLDSNMSDKNCRKCRINPEGWDMQESTYKKLIEYVMPDVSEVARLVDKYNLGNGTRWLENWENVWAENLETCDKITGLCKIRPS